MNIIKTPITARCHGHGKNKRCLADTGNLDILYCKKHTQVNKFKIDKNRNHIIRYSLHNLRIPRVLSDLILSYDFFMNHRPIGQFRGFYHRVNCIKIISNDKCVTGSDDGIIRIWDLADGKCVNIIQGHPLEVKNILVLSDGKIVSCCSLMIKIWDPVINNCERSFYNHISSHTLMRFIFDNNSTKYEKLICGSGKNIMIWDVEKDQLEKTMQCHDGIILNIDVDCDSDHVDTKFPRIISTGVGKGEGDCVIKIWNRTTYECMNILTGHQKNISFLKLKNNFVYSHSNLDDTLRIWDSTTGICIFIISSCFTNGSIQILDNGDVFAECHSKSSIFGMEFWSGKTHFKKWNFSDLEKCNSDIDK